MTEVESHEQESNHQGYFRCADGASGYMVLRVILSRRLCARLRHLSEPDIAAYGGGFAALLCGIVFLWQLFLQKGNWKGANLQFHFSDSDGWESGTVGEQCRDKG